MSASKDTDSTKARDISIYKQYLQLIASGEKTIEVRVAYPSMKGIAPGQLLRFFAGNEQCLARVKRVSAYASFEELLDHEDAQAIGTTQSREELLGLIREIYPPEKEALGVLAIEVERMSADS
jgi:ASC-1-like (ASCH) protein